LLWPSKNSDSKIESGVTAESEELSPSAAESEELEPSAADSVDGVFCETSEIVSEGAPPLMLQEATDPLVMTIPITAAKAT
jgi:hypothetical protein